MALVACGRVRNEYAIRQPRRRCEDQIGKQITQDATATRRHGCCCWRVLSVRLRHGPSAVCRHGTHEDSTEAGSPKAKPGRRVASRLFRRRSRLVFDPVRGLHCPRITQGNEPGSCFTCPNCETVFRIDSERISEGGQAVRCSVCSHVWQAEPPMLVPELDPARCEAPSVPCWHRLSFW